MAADSIYAINSAKIALTKIITGGTNRFVLALAVSFVFALFPLLGIGFRSASFESIIFILAPFLLILLRSIAGFHKLRDDIRRELGCLDAFCREGNALWGRTQPLISASLTQTDILSLVPAPIRQETKHSKFLLEEIASAKIHLLDSPNESIVRQHKEELETRLRELTGLGSLGIRLGVLGTFIGFLLAILALGNLFGGLSPSGAYSALNAAASPNGTDWLKWSGEIKGALHDLAFKFVSSICGLVVAIVVSIQASEIRRLLNEFYRLFDNSLSIGRAFINRMTLADPMIHSSLTQVRDALVSVEQRMVDHGQRINSALKSHGGIINSEVERFAGAAQQLSEAQKQWDTAFQKMNAAFNGIEFGTSLVARSVENGITGASRALESALESFKNGETQFSNLIVHLDTISKETSDKWQAQHNHLRTQLDESTQNYSAGIGNIVQNIGALKNDMNCLSNTILELSKCLNASIHYNKVFVKNIAEMSKLLSGALSQPVQKQGSLRTLSVALSALALSVSAGVLAVTVFFFLKEPASGSE